MVEDKISFFTLSNVIVMGKKVIYGQREGESVAAIRRRSLNSGDHNDAGL